MQSKAEERQDCPKGPPDAVHVSSRLVRPVQNTKIYLQQQTPKMKHGRKSADCAQHVLPSFLTGLNFFVWVIEVSNNSQQRGL